MTDRECQRYYEPTDDEYFPTGYAEAGTTESAATDADYPGWVCTTLLPDTTEGRRERVTGADRTSCTAAGGTWQPVLGDAHHDRVVVPRTTCVSCEYEDIGARDSGNHHAVTYSCTGVDEAGAQV